jgi:hypothetical protein
MERAIVKAIFAEIEDRSGRLKRWPTDCLEQK